MKTRPTRRAIVVLVTAALALTLVPPAKAYHYTQPIPVETIQLPVLSPIAGSNYFVKASCSNGQSCIHVNSGGWVEYSLTVSQLMDLLSVSGKGTTSFGSTYCEIHIDYRRPDGTGFWTNRVADCPKASPYATEEQYPFETTAAGASYKLTMACPSSSCLGFDLHSFTAQTYHAGLSQYIAVRKGPALFERCMDVQVQGSMWYGPDYFRISWGDGTETTENIDWTQWEWWERGLYLATHCHFYAPSVLPYQACSTVHDTLGRFLRDCTDVVMIPP